MRRTKRQKYLLIAFAVALAAFLADRIQPGLGPSRPSQAEASEGMDIGAMLPESGAALLQEALAERLPGARWALADRLEEIAQKHRLELTGVKDAFRPAESWVGQPPKKKQEPPVDPDKARKARVEQFVKSHQLQAVVIADHDHGAIINGRYLSVGQWMDGFKLESVYKKSVVMVSQGAKAVLTLAEGVVEANG